MASRIDRYIERVNNENIQLFAENREQERAINRLRVENQQLTVVAQFIMDSLLITMFFLVMILAFATMNSFISIIYNHEEMMEIARVVEVVKYDNFTPFLNNF